MLSEKDLFEAIKKSETIKKLLSEALLVSSTTIEQFIDSKIMKLDTHVSNEVVYFVDGGSRGNPGPAAAGVFRKDEFGEKGFYYFIGNATNNVAEYRALLFALEDAVKTKAQVVKVYADSKLVVQQINIK